MNTKSPLGIFHIDASGNNSVTPTAAQLADDIIVKSDGMGEVGIGIGAIPAKGASVDLISSNKGLQLNVVALTGTDDLLTVIDRCCNKAYYPCTIISRAVFYWGRAEICN